MTSGRRVRLPRNGRARLPGLGLLTRSTSTDSANSLLFDATMSNIC